MLVHVREKYREATCPPENATAVKPTPQLGSKYFILQSEEGILMMIKVSIIVVKAGVFR